ncbi:uncharacterized protein LOC106941588 [Poecilia latipinna]|uniref:uncharacterized protein LOC106941588 n=1 Tax=Poecilia latipinna TaxID=48699 RepID=UPI00072DACED|nr:PREDICTED: uncharacterized protein LOC106941588 [Poecilia latipinna]
MKNFVFIGAVLFSCCWISVVSQTVSVLPGENVNLLCNKHSGPPLFWFRLVNRTRISCISVSLSGSTRYCDEFKSGSFNIWSNSSTSVLRINQLNVSDSGLYFCGFATKQHRLFTATQLHVNGTKEFEGETEIKEKTPEFKTLLIIFLLCAANGLLIVIIIILIIVCLVCKAKKSKKADDSSRNPEQSEDAACIYENCTTGVVRVNTIYDSYCLS